MARGFRGLLLTCLWALPCLGAIDEASGVTRDGGRILVVDDSEGGAYFRVPVQAGPGTLIPLSGSKVQRVVLKRARMALDLEGIERLADGRIVLLSERLHCLVSKQGVVVEYDSALSEFGKRGLEGLAVRALPGRASRVAVLWEGGYPDYESVPIQLRDKAGRVALRPLVMIHDLQRGATGVRIRLRDFSQSVELQAPVPEGSEPEAQRFRTPDLIWYPLRGNSATEEWGFLVLMSSQNSVAKPDYAHHWLQRFRLDGKPYGRHVDIDEIVPLRVKQANWEGLAWYEYGKSVVVVHEGQPHLPPNAFILELPPDWQFQP